MNWLAWIIVGTGIVGFLALKRLALLDSTAAHDYLKKGAKVVDARSEQEFQQDHLPRAINIPLGRLKEEIDRQVPDKDQAVLLHCLSGGRSSIGKAILKRMGYRNAFNLGSLGRARRILGA